MCACLHPIDMCVCIYSNPKNAEHVKVYHQFQFSIFAPWEIFGCSQCSHQFSHRKKLGGCSFHTKNPFFHHLLEAQWLWWVPRRHCHKPQRNSTGRTGRKFPHFFVPWNHESIWIKVYFLQKKHPKIPSCTCLPAYFGWWNPIFDWFTFQPGPLNNGVRFGSLFQSDAKKLWCHTQLQACQSAGRLIISKSNLVFLNKTGHKSNADCICTWSL